MRKNRRVFLSIVLPIVILILLIIVLTGAGPEGEEEVDMGFINILWAEWDPADYLQELSNNFTIETGIAVEVEQIHRLDFQIRAFNEFETHGDTFDIIVGDSQWLGRGAAQGHYVELTDWMKERGVDKSMAPAAITAFAEYPKGSGKYWAVPVEGDACGWSYRKDKFEDPEEKAAFKAKYDYELDIPETWDQLLDIAEFFYRPGENFYGAAIYTKKEYNAITMGVENLLWAYGADLGNYETYRVKGILNSPGGIEALKLYRKLYKFCPLGWGNAFFMDNNLAFTEGIVAMSMNYYTLFPALDNSEMSRYAAVTGYFAMPAGPKGRYAALGGQGASIITYSKKQDLAYEWLEWFIKPENQAMWGELGGYTCDLNTLKSDEFLKMTPYNRSFMETMQIGKDFWTVPEYAELLESCQRYWHESVVDGTISAKDAMDGIAEEWEVIFKKFGYYK